MRRVLILATTLLLAGGVVYCGSSDEPLAPATEAGVDSAVVTDGSPPDVAAQDGARDGGALGPTAPRAIGTSPGKDEDPSVVRAADGTFYLAWYSDRDGTDRIYLVSSKDGADWTAPRPITTADRRAFYPSLIQSKDGRFHLVWWQAGATSASVWYASSADTMVWSTPTKLADDGAVDWTPTITERAPGELFVAWSSNAGGDKDIYVLASSNGGQSWAAAPSRRVDPAFNDDIPFITSRADGSLIMIWERFDPALTALEAAYGDPSNDLVYATSQDGGAWSAPLPVTNDPALAPIADVIPSLYPSADPSGFSAAWTTTRGGVGGAGNIVTLELGAAPAAASARRLTTPAISAYSARLVPAGVPGLYFMAWVEVMPGPDGGTQPDVYYRFLVP